jgi:hypothetical protein
MLQTARKSMDAPLEAEINRLKNLKSCKTLAIEELTQMALINLKVKEFKVNPIFTDAAEQAVAEQKFKSYLENHEIESMSDIDTLKSLVYNEVFEIRIQRELNKLHTEGKYPPDRLTNQLTSLQNQKSELKLKLGIDKPEAQVSELTQLQQLEKRYDAYIQEHRHEFELAYTYTCSKCNHQDVDMVLVRRRVKDFDAMLHPWFAGRWFFNYEILKDVKAEKITKEDAWRYLCCASQGGNYKPAFSKEYCTDYIDYCLEHWAEITSFLNLEQ